jgi:hypothetical protein
MFSGDNLSRMGEIRTACRILVQISGRKILLGRFWHRYEDNIKIDLKI